MKIIKIVKNDIIGQTTIPNGSVDNYLDNLKIFGVSNDLNIFPGLVVTVGSDTNEKIIIKYSNTI